MNKLSRVLIVTLILFGGLLYAKSEALYRKAIESCEAYNNLKHTKNSNNLKLQVGKEYKILETRDKQFLIYVDGERIAQRWVDKSCFSSDSLKKDDKKHVKKSTFNLLAISWQNAFCELKRRAKECEDMDAFDYGASNFVLHGLWPQPKNRLYCNVDKKLIGADKNRQWYRLPKLDLLPEVREELQKYMPGYLSYLHRHEWIKHGTCYGTDPNTYFKDAITLLKQINNSKVRDLFAQNIGKVLTIKKIREVFDMEFGKGAGKKVAMVCQKGLITELWIYLKGKSLNLKELLSSDLSVKSRCYKGKVDSVGYSEYF